MTTSALKSAIDATSDALTLNPAAANVGIGSTSHLCDDFAVDVHVGDRRVPVDMPEPFGGGGSAPTPGEIALAALGSCQAITYRLWSEKLGITIGSLTVDVRADIDVRALVGVSDAVRPGFGKVEVDVVISGPETPERYEELRQAVDAHCPILDVFAHEVPSRTNLSVL
jgi:uncharacterized OsmC-like protein